MVLNVLTQEQLKTFDRDGYVVVSEAVPTENLQAVIDAAWEFLEMDPNDSSTWYPYGRGSSLVHLHQHQALWNNRQHPRVHGAFADLLGMEKLWVSMDRAAMKPPIDPRYPHYKDSGFIHWDLDTSKPLPEKLGVQGVLALTDTTEEMGGFHCIPGFHKNLAAWLSEQPADRNPRVPDVNRLPEGMKITPIPMKAGDLVIWNRLLAHGNGRNDGKQPRMAQYITMHPASEDEEARQERIACWQERRAPHYWEREIPEPYRGRETKNPPAELTALGRKLLGLDRWD
ncbi:MAG: DUF1479 family protein [Armatimonadaceae bacterium]